jgi:SAM-dependent methyltransferase
MHHEDTMIEFWNQRYGAAEYAYGTEPNTFFKQQLRLLPAGRLFLPGEGEGRNAVYAARNGWSVHAVDLSQEGRKKALSLATARGVSITYTVTDLSTYEPSRDTFDAAALIFVHFPPALRRLVHTRVIDALKPGGVLIIEAFGKDQLARDTGGPRSAEMLYAMDDLLDDLSGMEIELHASLITDILEGPYHSGPSDVHRIVARKPWQQQ